MTEHQPQIKEEPRVEEHRVFVLLAFPIFMITIVIVVLIATLGTK